MKSGKFFPSIDKTYLNFYNYKNLDLDKGVCYTANS